MSPPVSLIIASLGFFLASFTANAQTARPVSLSAQVDDVFLASQLWEGGTYRMTPADVNALVIWQRNVQKDPVTAGFILHMAFNGALAVATDPLTASLKKYEADFVWISHGFTHADLTSAKSTVAAEEAKKNNAKAKELGLSNYRTESYISAGHTGLKNPEALKGLHSQGVRYMVADTSYLENARPKMLAPGILQIPRHPTDLYFNVSTPQQWVNEYNHLHRSSLSYEQILNKESDTMVRYLLNRDISPLMFHQANLRAYDGVHSLLSDLLDATFAKYKLRSSEPIVSLDQDQIGALYAEELL